MKLSRRAFLSHGGQAACLCTAGLGTVGLGLRAGTAEAKLAVVPPLSVFHHGEVQLGDGPLLTQFAYQHRLFMAIDNDALLKPFRVRAGQDAPGADMGGWYDNAPEDFHVDPTDWSTANWHGFIPGHSFGQYISGLARDYAITGDAATKVKIEALIAAYEPTISPKFFDDYTLPAYTYDKLLVGLMDAWTYAGVAAAKPAAAKMTEAALPFLPEKALTRDEMQARPHNRPAQTFDESYTLPENLFLAWQRGMGEQYRALALKYVADDGYFGPLSQGVNPLGTQHAYSHVNGLSSAVQTYLVTGDEKYLRAAINGFQFLSEQSFATGGWGANEGLLSNGDTETLLKTLTESHSSFETPCGVYGHFKIARYLMRLTKDSRYGDSMERILYNTILGAKPTEPDGHTFYYSDYNMAAKKGFHPNPWPCCSGTFIQLTADYGISAYVYDAQALYVNLYVPSKVQANLGGRKVLVTQATTYPATNVSTFTIALDTPASFSVNFRVPAWAGAKTMLTVNSKPVCVALTPGTFAAVTRTWHDGDTVEISFDMGLRLEPLNAAHPEMVALMTGPVVLFPVADGAAPLTRDELLSASGGDDAWTITASDRSVQLKPFPAIGDETYRLYTPLRT